MYNKKTRDDGQRKCPKHVEFYSKNKFEKLAHLAGFIIRIICEILQSKKMHILNVFMFLTCVIQVPDDGPE